MRIPLLRILTLLVATTPADAEPPKSIRETWASDPAYTSRLDSVTSCRLRDRRVLLFASSIAGNRIDIYDAATGSLVTSYGSKGDKPGQFNRPNGVAAVRFSERDADTGETIDRWAITVVERDNARVQSFWPEGHRFAGIFAAGELKRPLGCAVAYASDGPHLFLTESKSGPDSVVREYRLNLRDNRIIEGTLVRAFGDATGTGAVLKAESLTVDEPLGHVLVCDEESTRRNVKVYDLNGKFTGKTFGDGIVTGDPEGIAVYLQPEGGGFIVLTDQRKDLTVWHLFDRRDYKLLGSFTGEPVVANTDGICLITDRFGPFQKGAMFAVHADQCLKSYPLAEIIRVAPAANSASQASR